MKVFYRMAAVIAGLFAIIVSADAQVFNVADTSSMNYRDSIIYVQSPVMDMTLAGMDIFSLLGGVTLEQPANVRAAMGVHVANNAKRGIQGYRIRIFFDNRQNARAESEKVQKEFRHLFPELQAYRSYANPYFKVTVGDFRTRSEAMVQLNRIKGIYPSAFLVKEQISYPVVDRRHPVIRDTVKVAVMPSSQQPFF